MRAIEFRTEARRLRTAVRHLTSASRHDADSNYEDTSIRHNIEHCRAMLVKGIPDEPQRQLIAALLQYMESSSVVPACTDSHCRHDGFSRPAQAHERRLHIVARELIRGRGLQTVSYLREIAEIATDVGDQRSAEAWNELADAADRILEIASREE